MRNVEPGRDISVPGGWPSQVPCASSPRRTASDSQCGRSGHLRLTTRTLSTAGV